MKVAVWDTYVKRRNGSVMHFDIVVPETQKNAATIYEYGKNYLTSKGEEEGKLATEECRFCHVEEPTAEMLSAIEKNGYYIIEMEEIPASLTVTPTRREMILHLRAHYPEYRFADFKGKSEDEVRKLFKEKI